LNTIGNAVSRKRRAASNGRASPVAEEKEPVKGRLSSPDQVVAAIKRGIRLGRYVAGQRLVEADLTHDYEVSRGPVREALKRLAAEGVVVLSPHRGAFIRLLSRSEASELLQVVEVLIILATRLAANRIHERANRARFERSYKRLGAQRADAEAVFLAVERTQFYETIVHIAGNVQLQRINPSEQTQLLRLQVQPFLPSRERSRQFADYALLASAVLAGDAERAERIIRGHTRRARAHIDLLPDAAFGEGR